MAESLPGSLVRLSAGLLAFLRIGALANTWAWVSWAMMLRTLLIVDVLPFTVVVFVV